jgi:hypothetical protein
MQQDEVTYCGQINAVLPEVIEVDAVMQFAYWLRKLRAFTRAG